MATRNGKRGTPLLPADKGPIREEWTPEITGMDAPVAQAELGDAGNGADPYGADLEGGVQHLEDEPAGEDIGPDEVRLFPRESDLEEREITAQPNDHLPPDPTDDG